jgi:hypothetical protein
MSRDAGHVPQVPIHGLVWIGLRVALSMLLSLRRVMMMRLDGLGVYGELTIGNTDVSLADA